MATSTALTSLFESCDSSWMTRQRLNYSSGWAGRTEA